MAGIVRGREDIDTSISPAKDELTEGKFPTSASLNKDESEETIALEVLPYKESTIADSGAHAVEDSAIVTLDEYNTARTGEIYYTRLLSTGKKFTT